MVIKVTQVTASLSSANRLRGHLPIHVYKYINKRVDADLIHVLCPLHVC